MKAAATVGAPRWAAGDLTTLVPTEAKVHPAQPCQGELNGGPTALCAVTQLTSVASAGHTVWCPCASGPEWEPRLSLSTPETEWGGTQTFPPWRPEQHYRRDATWEHSALVAAPGKSRHVS